jgi:endonuclease YncB( thermonuclease family)
MSKITFEGDPSSRKVTRFLFFLQVTGMGVVLGLCLLRSFFLAFLLSLVTLILSLAAIFWLRARYRELPQVREKRKLRELFLRFQEKSLAEGRLMQEAAREREGLNQAEKDEIHEMKNGNPVGLVEVQVEGIRRKYQELHARNDASQRKARASKQLLDHEMVSFQGRLQELAPLTFINYLSNALSPRGVIAGLLGAALVIAQLVSSVSAGRFALLSSQAGMVPLPTQTRVPLETDTPAPTEEPTAEPGRLATETLMPTLAATELVASTLQPSQTALPQATLPVGIAACIPQTTSRESGQVVNVVDGDTIDVRIGEQTFRVRYIGINTPEQDQTFYQEATAYNQKLVAGQTVTLVKDTSETDQFDRLLRYVIAGDLFVNHELVAKGYAAATAYAPDTACVTTLEVAQRQAQTAKVGLWLPTPELLVPPITGGDDSGNCDPSYPGVCIAPAPPDLDCGDIPYKRFQVLPPDPHNFDRDGDGVGCES